VPSSASKQRPQWAGLSVHQRRSIEGVVGHHVTHAESRTGGFSPGFVSVLRLDDGREVFVKAIDLLAWPDQGETYRREIAVARALPAAVPAPRLLASGETGDLVILVFEAVRGMEPRQPWDESDLVRVCQAADALSVVAAPRFLASEDLPRLGGWWEIADDEELRVRSEELFPWASGRLQDLVAWEQRGLTAARGRTLAHFDLYAHNTLLTNDDVAIVDWPHARRAAPYVDTVMLLSTANDGQQSERIWRDRPVSRVANPDDVTAVLVAHAGSCAASASWPMTPGLEAITAAKANLARGAISWLEERWVD
jgi:hypothetical protein